MSRLGIISRTIILTFLLAFKSTETKSEIYAVDVSRMKFERTFYKSDDFITAIDLHPTKTNLICGANYSGRIFIHDILRRKQVMESHLQLQKRKSSTSDIDVIECPHVFIMKYSHEGHHLICGMENGLLLILDPDILTELSTIKLSSARILDLKFSEDSSFLATYVNLSNHNNFIKSMLKLLIDRTNCQQLFCCIVMTLIVVAGWHLENSISIRSQFVTSFSFNNLIRFLNRRQSSCRDWFHWHKIE